MLRNIVHTYRNKNVGCKNNLENTSEINVFDSGMYSLMSGVTLPLPAFAIRVNAPQDENTFINVLRYIPPPDNSVGEFGETSSIFLFILNVISKNDSSMRNMAYNPLDQFAVLGFRQR